ncbi:hypothetical protein F2Q69_00033472 [Brassica cretica]|uniref:Pentacotripeptide-repeat region of PRORP domain-containing protein n=1 Tax=Brassica cretica TaxID=69181 RepID=A0A8S9STA5_BRACR|nr:hypothetical protein F2Q69_00033472 [Brassica cretica]
MTCGGVILSFPSSSSSSTVHGKIVLDGILTGDDFFSVAIGCLLVFSLLLLLTKEVKKVGKNEHHLWKKNDSAGSGQKALNLVRMLSGLPNEKEVVYGALNKWVAWEVEFPIVAAAKALQILRKRSQWHRVIQVSNMVAKWMLSKGQGATMGTYDTLLLAFDMEERTDEAESLWNMILHTHTRSIPRRLFARMIALYAHHDLQHKVIEVFADMEELKVRPDEDTARRVARAFREIGQEEKQELVLRSRHRGAVMNQVVPLFPKMEHNRLRSQLPRQKVAKWMLSKGQGATMGTYDTLLLAFDMEERADEAESLWNMILHTHTRSIPRRLFARMIALYAHHDLQHKVIEVFADMEELKVRPDEDTARRVARAFRELGQEEKQELILRRYLSEYKYIYFNGERVRVKRYSSDEEG